MEKEGLLPKWQREIRGRAGIFDNIYVVIGGTLSNRKIMYCPNKVTIGHYPSKQDKQNLIFGCR